MERGVYFSGELILIFYKWLWSLVMESLKIWRGHQNTFFFSSTHSTNSRGEMSYKDTWGFGNVKFSEYTCLNFKDLHTKGCSPALVWTYPGTLLLNQVAHLHSQVRVCAPPFPTSCRYLYRLLYLSMWCHFLLFLLLRSDPSQRSINVTQQVF